MPVHNVTSFFGLSLLRKLEAAAALPFGHGWIRMSPSGYMSGDSISFGFGELDRLRLVESRLVAGETHVRLVPRARPFHLKARQWFRRRVSP
jgi:hypothetical protein